MRLNWKNFHPLISETNTSGYLWIHKRGRTHGKIQYSGFINTRINGDIVNLVRLNQGTDPVGMQISMLMELRSIGIIRPEEMQSVIDGIIDVHTLIKERARRHNESIAN